MALPAPVPVDPALRPVAQPTLSLVATLDLLTKLVLLFFLLLVLVDPEWGNLEGKAPVARAVVYPLFALIVPAWWVLRRRGTPFPWLADLLVTVACFSDILGNRLDLYDAVSWFDDAVHLVNTAFLCAAFVLMTRSPTARVAEILQASVALGMTVSLAWEVFEYLAFLTTSDEWPSAYRDTLGDLVLGWLGAVAAGLLVAATWRHERAADRGAQRTTTRAPRSLATSASTTRRVRVSGS